MADPFDFGILQGVGEEGLKQMLAATPLDFSKFNPAPPVSTIRLRKCVARASVLCHCWKQTSICVRVVMHQRAQMDELLGDAGLASLL